MDCTRFTWKVSFICVYTRKVAQTCIFESNSFHRRIFPNYRHVLTIYNLVLCIRLGVCVCVCVCRDLTSCATQGTQAQDECEFHLFALAMASEVYSYRIRHQQTDANLFSCILAQFTWILSVVSYAKTSLARVLSVKLFINGADSRRKCCPRWDTKMEQYYNLIRIIEKLLHYNWMNDVFVSP